MREFVDLVEQAAKARNEPRVPRDYIVEAAERIERGKEKVECYPTGLPSLKAVYEVAARLYREVTSK